MKKLIALMVVVVAVWAGSGYLATMIDRDANPVVPQGILVPSERAKALHAELNIMDWHADTLLWKRSLLTPVDHSQVDLPRLQAGNVSLQMFTVVSKALYKQNNELSEETWDMVTPLTIVQGWPPRTWTSLLERALFQSEKLQRAVDDANHQLRWIKSREDLEVFLLERQSNRKLVGALFGSEGAHILEGDLSNVSVMYDAGLRMMGLQHFFDNELGGSLHSAGKGGLTDFGREVIAELDRRRVIIDLAHSSEAVVADVLAITQRPVVVSHTGFKGACNTARNISDELMQQIAAKGGLIAVGYWDSAVCDASPTGIAKTIQYGIDLVGEDHVALGSDFDGSVTTPMDTSDLIQLTQALLDLGVTEAQIRKVMGDNSIAFLRANLPSVVL